MRDSCKNKFCKSGSDCDFGWTETIYSFDHLFFLDYCAISTLYYGPFLFRSSLERDGIQNTLKRFIEKNIELSSTSVRNSQT